MFGGESLGGFELTDEDRQYGRYTLTTVINCATRCVASGRFCAGDPVAGHPWPDQPRARRLPHRPVKRRHLLRNPAVTLMVGEGDTLEAATHGPDQPGGKRKK
jgi:hypothetical protein